MRDISLSSRLPILPPGMIDYVNSPVPFIAGTVSFDLPDIENDDRVLEAMSAKMSLLNLSATTLLITTERNVAWMLSLDPYLREQLGYLRSRIVELQQLPGSALSDLKTFVSEGPSPNEALTLRSVRLALEGYFSRFCGDLAQNSLAWKRYGTIDAANNNKFTFWTDWFLNSARADHAFQEHVVWTQLSYGYVDQCRIHLLSLCRVHRWYQSFRTGWQHWNVESWFSSPNTRRSNHSLVSLTVHCEAGVLVGVACSSSLSAVDDVKNCGATLKKAWSPQLLSLDGRDCCVGLCSVCLFFSCMCC